MKAEEKLQAEYHAWMNSRQGPVTASMQREYWCSKAIELQEMIRHDWETKGYIVSQSIKQKANEFWYRWARNQSINFLNLDGGTTQFATDFAQWLRNGEKFPEHWR